MSSALVCHWFPSLDEYPFAHISPGIVSHNSNMSQYSSWTSRWSLGPGVLWGIGGSRHAELETQFLEEIIKAAAMLKADVGSSLRLTEALQRESLSCEHPWGEN